MEKQLPNVVCKGSGLGESVYVCVAAALASLLSPPVKQCAGNH